VNPTNTPPRAAVQVPAQAGAGDDEEAVAAHLRRHPDFLQRHPDVLAVLDIAHPCDGAVSLIEHQVQALRREAQATRERLAALVENARSNEELAQRLHRLLLALLESPAMDELLTSLYQGLEEGFGADRVRLRIFAHPRAEEDRGLAELLGPDDPGLSLFAALLESRQPSCGAHRGPAARWLFGAQAEELGSMALLPLELGPRHGVLAIASKNAARYTPAMGTLYLRQLADVLGRLLAPRVR